ncbi:putative laccase [Helianthus annuus]|nr:putative laccase [Helianthus annuus]
MASWVRSAVMVLAMVLLPMMVESYVRHYKFTVVMKNFTRLCESKAMVTINGKFPGPTLYAREDDSVVVQLVNKVPHNITIHWHGIRQLRTGWSDGPAYITQCPIQTGHSYTYKFNVTGQRGTLLWHAHITWLRATVHGAIVILPKHGVPYPFPKPDYEKIIVLGEWWKSDVDAVMNQWMQTGLPPNVSDAHTINGYPGPVPNCSTSKGSTLHVEPGKTYLLRIINAALNEELFFKIARHQFTVVEVDACYVKPFKTHTIYIAPGQTTNALFTADQKPGKYLMAISPFMDTIVAIDNQTATGTVRYKSIESYTPSSLLQAHYYHISGVFTRDFPGKPLTPYNYTGVTNLTSMQITTGTKVYPLKYNSTVQVVMQGNSVIAPESHPIHLHGFNFFIVGKGVGNFDPVNDPKNFNLVDPVERNTLNIPTSGWTAIRFRADNPGVWFLHCHLEVHTTWGLKMAFLVENGKGPNESLIPPPKDLPTC